MSHTPSLRCVYSPEHLRHDPEHEVSQGHAVGMYELPIRAEEVRAALEADEHAQLVAPTEHGRGPIDAVHDPGLVAFLEQAWAGFAAESPGAHDAIPDSFLHPALREGMGLPPAPSGGAARLGYYTFDTATPLVEGTYPAARAAVDVALTALDLVLAGERLAYGLCRPPGHHAPRAAYGGYCFFNNAAVAAQRALDAGAARVTVLDVDYHHGNGTQQIFYGRGDVQYVSLHADPNRAYPYFAGFAEETGTGAGSGATVNLPLPVRMEDDAYLAVLDQALEAVDGFDPAVLVVSLGVDTYHLDPIGDLGLTRRAFWESGVRVAAGGWPLVVLQEGGYHVPDLGQNVRAWLRGAGGVPMG